MDRLTPPPFAYCVRSSRRGSRQVHRQLEVVSINEHNLLYTGKGLNPKLPAILLTGHHDVVSAESEVSTGNWDAQPFSGEIRDGYIWGRGAMEDKAGVAAILLAFEKLLAEGLKPTSNILLALGHDIENTIADVFPATLIPPRHSARFSDGQCVERCRRKIGA